MEIPDYPPNKFDRREPVQDKNIKRVTSDDPIRRKKSLRKQFQKVFVAGDFKGAIDHVVFDVMLPAARDIVYETGSEFISRLMYGDSRRRGSTPPQSGPTGVVSYNRMYSMGTRQTGPQRAFSRRARASHDFDEVVLASRAEAEEVIDRMYEVVSQYGIVTVADLYELVGIAASHTDNKWGWHELRGAGVSRTRDGYLLDLPQPTPVD